MKKNNYCEILLIDSTNSKILLETINSNTETYRLPFVTNKQNSKDFDTICAFKEKYNIEIKLRDLIFLGLIQRENEENKIYLCYLDENTIIQNNHLLSICELDNIIQKPFLLERHLK